MGYNEGIEDFYIYILYHKGEKTIKQTITTSYPGDTKKVWLQLTIYHVDFKKVHNVYIGHCCFDQNYMYSAYIQVIYISFKNNILCTRNITDYTITDKYSNL